MVSTRPGFLRGIIAVNRGSQPHHTQEEADMDAMTVAVDLAKDVFEVALRIGGDASSSVRLVGTHGKLGRASRSTLRG
jgi:hypothetical protein